MECVGGVQSRDAQQRACMRVHNLPPSGWGGVSGGCGVIPRRFKPHSSLSALPHCPSFCIILFLTRTSPPVPEPQLPRALSPTLLHSLPFACAPPAAVSQDGAHALKLSASQGGCGTPRIKVDDAERTLRRGQGAPPPRRVLPGRLPLADAGMQRRHLPRACAVQRGACVRASC